MEKREKGKGKPKKDVETRRAASSRWEKLFPTETTSSGETRALGERIAAHLTAGDLVALYGDLGAGKTQLAKGIGRGLGVPERDVRSPTFTLVHEHAEGGRLPLYHIDAYRLGDPDELRELGYERYFYGEGVCVVEWPGRIEALLPETAIRLRLSHQGRDKRRIERVEAEGMDG
jgi:tRNA threonylcarbamoyladenosine biosynthesis protein TsaE